MCDCNTRDNDVCPVCLVSVLDDSYKSLTIEKIDALIEIKQLLLSMIQNSVGAKQIKIELYLLSKYRKQIEEQQV